MSQFFQLPLDSHLFIDNSYQKCYDKFENMNDLSEQYDGEFQI